MAPRFVFSASIPASNSPSHGSATPGTTEHHARLPFLDKRELNERELKMFFSLAVAVAKTQYVDFEQFAVLNSAGLYERVRQEGYRPIEWLYFAKDAVRRAYREGKLISANVDPERFIHRMWQLVGARLMAARGGGQWILPRLRFRCAGRPFLQEPGHPRARGERRVRGGRGGRSAFDPSDSAAWRGEEAKAERP